ncbi:unnamed protein product, partial [Rhizoctonia solani]
MDEIINGESKPTEASDIFALGMIIYEVVSREVPYGAAKDPATMMSIAKGVHPARPETYLPTGV